MNRFNYEASLLLSFTLLFTPMIATNLYIPIAQADAEGIRSWCADNSVDGSAINSQYQSDEQWKYGFYAPEPHAGDTPLLYAIRAALHVWHQHISMHVFHDINTFRIALTRRLEIIRQLLFHPQSDLTIKNAHGQTAQSLTFSESFYPAIEMFRLLDYHWGFERARSEQNNSHEHHIALYQSKLDAMQIDTVARERLQKLLDSAKHARHSSEGVFREVLKLAFSLPWEPVEQEQPMLADVHTTLDTDHYGLTKVKEKILDFVATRMLNPRARGKILCLIGPPGTGKTSIAQSIARGLKRPFEKISLGGSNDPVRINGIERVYVGAHPGAIITALSRAKAKNAVILLDEIDKLAARQGDPGAALLEVLDPEQNKIFTDKYLDVPFDLSEVFFICTANEYATISMPLRDRMEFIEIAGYSADEKLHIAQRYLVPKAAQATGIDASYTLTEPVIREIITNYTFEAGVRNLARHIATLCAKVARAQIAKEPVPQFTATNLVPYLGRPFFLEFFNKDNKVGVANGLAVYHGAQGIGLTIEVALLPGGKGNVHATKNLGEKTGQTSASIALSYARAHAQELGIALNKFTEFDLVIHTPGEPGDGPSAGVALLSAIVSAMTNKPVDASWAMTGEISLTGNVMIVGGVRDKLLAAKRMGIMNVIIPAANAPDLTEEPEAFAGMRIVPVKTAREVLDLVLVKA